MISHIASQGFSHLASSTSASSTPSTISSIDKGEPSSTESPVPTGNDSQKIKGTVNTQEGQAGKKDKQGQSDKEKTTTQETNSPVELSEDELKEVQKLKQRDIEVRAHEAAHLAAAGQHAQGGAKFTLKKGPDGRSYAVGGSVSIDTSPEADPEATLRKADQIKRAALAPAEPSGQDRSVAAQATKMKLEAQAQIAEEQRSEVAESSEKISSSEEPKPAVAAAPPPATSEGGEKSDSPPGELKTGVEAVKSAAETLCEICSGGHPTGPHLEANQRKTNQYVAVSQS